MHLQHSPTFGNATGISSSTSSHHFLKKMNLTNHQNNNNNIVLPRIKNNNTTTTTTTQACAACKYQRRKCEPNCILSPYFPHNRQSQFLNAHKLFGVSNITKIIRDLNPAEKDQAMKTIIFQSDVRANDPVGGCYRIIKELQFMIEYYQSELDLVMHQLSIFRTQHHADQAQNTIKEQQENINDQQFLPFITTSDDQALNNKCSDPNSDVINADTLSTYSPSSLQCDFQHQEQLSLQLGGIISHRGSDDGDDDDFILVNDNVRENVDINDTWLHQKNDDDQEEERMVKYCLNENDEDRCVSKDSFDDHKKGSSFEEDHEGGSSYDETILNDDAKNLCRLEGNINSSIRGEVYRNEEASDEWFRLADSKRRKTTV